MEFHYPVLSKDTEQLKPEYVAPYVVPSADAEYQFRTSVLVDGGNRFGVSSAVFDKYEELIWMGNQGGHVTSYYGPTMQKYTSFQIHASEEVRDIITTDQGIYALTKSSLRHQIRRGIPKHTFRSNNMTDMQCLFQLDSNKILMGGHQNELLELDLEKMKETVIPIKEESCAILRSGGGTLVTCGSVSGVVTLRDMRCIGKSEHTFSAHSACLSDLDMQGDIIITCGFTDTGGVTVAEPYVLVWDVRCLRGTKSGGGGAWRAAISSPPLLLHFLPAVSGRAVAVSGDGNVAVLHVNAPDVEEKISTFQVDTQSSICKVMDISTTCQALVFGDQSGHLNLFSPQHNTEPVFNNFSKATEFATPLPNLPSVSLSDINFRLSSVPLPPLTSGNKWFNELPPDFYKKTYRKPKPIDPEVLKTMKMQGPIGYAPNPRTCKRNEFPYVLDTLDDLNSPKKDLMTTMKPIPKHYIKTEARISKIRDGDASEHIYNNTGFPGLEDSLPNSYCNPMLQILYYTKPLKAKLLAHTCAKEFCLSCELGFLFRMLDTSGGAPCKASNFLRAFRTVPEAAALGLILPDRGGTDPRIDIVALIQSWNRFILHQMHYEILATKKKDKELANLVHNASSPPKGGSRLGNAPLNTSRLNSRLMSAQGINGQKIFGEDFKYTELEFVGSRVEFDTPENMFNRDGLETWRPVIVVQSEVSGSGLPARGCHNMELSQSKGDREESDISRLFAIGRQQLNRCLKCNREEERESVALACALQYPTPSTQKEGSRCGFVELLRSSLASRRNTPAWCEHCRRFSPTVQRGRIVSLPPILAINCGGVTAHEKSYWAKGGQKEMFEIPKQGNGGKPCRYGLQCARPGCRFKHPDRADSSSQTPLARSPTRESHCVLPQILQIRLQTDGDISICDKSNSFSDQSKENEESKSPVEEKYLLSAAVVCVDDTPRNLVAFIQMTSEGEPQWYLFNDLSIVPISVEEVIHFNVWWKSPCVLFYTKEYVQETKPS